MTKCVKGQGDFRFALLAGLVVALWIYAGGSLCSAPTLE